MRGYDKRGLTAGAVLLLLCALDTSVAAADADLGTAGGFTYIQDTTTLAAGASSASIEADCPTGTRVVGGGAGMGTTGDESEVRLTSSFPFDGPDADDKPDDGWETRGVNLAGAAKGISSYAICGSGRVRYESDRERVPAGAGGGRAACRDSMHVSGGGVSVSGFNADHWLNRSRPFDGADANARPDDGWQGRVHNEGSGRRVTTFAVCVDDARSYVDVSTDSSPYAFVYCPAGSHLTGGGLSISGAPIEAHATAINPFTGTVNPPDTGLVAGFSQNFGPPKTLTGFSVCAN